MRSLVLVFSLVVLNIAHADFRFATYNIRNFDYDERSQTPTNINHLTNTIEDLKADLIAVQEINDDYTFKSMINNNFFGKYKAELTECGGAHDQRLGFVYNTNKVKLLSFHQDMRTVNVNNPGQSTCGQGSRPLAVAVFKRLDKNQKFLAISVHLKSGGQPKSIQKRFKQIKIIKKIIQEQRAKGIQEYVIMGDFNSTEYNLKGEVYRKFVNTVRDMGVIDLTAGLKCTAYWWGGQDDATQYPSQLDHILMSKGIVGPKMPKVETFGHCRNLKCKATLESDMGISFDEVSDHCPLLTEVK